VLQTNGDTIGSDLDAIIIRVVDVAQLSTHRVGVISDSTSDVASVGALVSGNDESVASGERVEFIVLPALDKLVVPDSFLLTCRDCCLKELVKLGVGVVVAVPERLTILGVIATVEALLRAVVDDGNTSGEKSEDESIAILPSIRLHREETGLIVVIDESADNAGILVIFVIVLKARAKIAH